jgi:hypothetical protein
MESQLGLNEASGAGTVFLPIQRETVETQSCCETQLCCPALDRENMQARPERFFGEFVTSRAATVTNLFAPNQKADPR